MVSLLSLLGEVQMIERNKMTIKKLMKTPPDDHLPIDSSSSTRLNQPSFEIFNLIQIKETLFPLPVPVRIYFRFGKHEQSTFDVRNLTEHKIEHIADCMVQGFENEFNVSFKIGEIEFESEYEPISGLYELNAIPTKDMDKSWVSCIVSKESLSSLV